jgi:methylated-DNA-[protein]-cysteine S-methyltransferase
MKGCQHGERLRGRVTSPVGDYVFEACPKGLLKVDQAANVSNANFLTLGKDVELVEGNATGISQAFVNWMKSYFEGKSTMAPPPVCPSVFGYQDDGQGKPQPRPFRSRVLEVLYKDVALGSTITYGGLAAAAGSAKAARAVGSAMANNPVALVVPCHRVLPASGGSIGAYAGGSKNDLKAWLLRHEGATKEST